MLVIWWRRGELRLELLPPSDREAMQQWLMQEAIEQASRAYVPPVVEVVLQRPPPAPPPPQAQTRLLGKWGGRLARRTPSRQTLGKYSADLDTVPAERVRQ